MSTIKIKTLSPVHIGNGNNNLKNNMDFVYISDSGDSYLAVIDINKVVEIVGESNIEKLVACINKEDNLKEFIERVAPKDTVVDEYAKRFIFYPASCNNLKGNTTMKEAIHDGMGNAYIPGSSLKGAIRTALTSTLARPYPNATSAKYVEKSIFGPSSNQDFMRFLVVGDAIFESACEDAIYLDTLNIVGGYNQRLQIKKEVRQLAEVIAAGEESTFRMRMNITKNVKAKTEQYNNMQSEASKRIKMPVFNSLDKLFGIINAHTKRMLNDEIAFWQDWTDNYNGEWDESMDAYIKKINEFIDECKQCDKEGNSCILRLGHASGYDSITGDLILGINEECSRSNMREVLKKDVKRYGEYPFPKSRRINKSGESVNLLGFVKLTKID